MENKKLAAELSDEELDQAAGGIAAVGQQKVSTIKMGQTTLTNSAVNNAASALGSVSATLGSTATTLGSAASTLSDTSADSVLRGADRPHGAASNTLAAVDSNDNI